MSPDFRSSSARRWPRASLAALVALLAALAAGSWWWMRGAPPPPRRAVQEANARGIGLMEQFRYAEAVKAFEEVVRLDPRYLPGRINLGIALLNAGSEDPPKLRQAQDLFEAILQQEPDNPYAHYCLGILLEKTDLDQAVQHYRAVTRIDPTDPSAWFLLANLLPDGPERLACLRQVLKLDPDHVGALNLLQLELGRQGKRKDQASLLARMQALEKAGAGHTTATRYTDMGRYAEVLGQPPEPTTPVGAGPLPTFQRWQKFSVQLLPGCHWARGEDFGQGPVAELRARVRQRFGATVVVLDYDRDGKPDLFLAGAVVENGQVRDLLLHNEGDGRFVDVTARAGLAAPHPTLGCCVADFDNDGYPDLFLTGAGSQRLYRNTGQGAFEDLTARAGLDRLNSVCLGAAFVDLDQDSDLDLVVAEYAPSPTEALKAWTGQGTTPGRLLVYLNTGEAPPVRYPNRPPPLKCRFRQAAGPRDGELTALQGATGPVVGVAASDLDHDGDLDLLVLTDHATPALALNERLLHFRRKQLPETVVPSALWNGAAVLDADHDGRSDLFLAGADQVPRLLLARSRSGEDDVGKWFEVGSVDSPPLLQAVAVDLDLDGWTDVVGLSAERRPIWLRNEGGQLRARPDALGPVGNWPAGPRNGELLAVSVLDADGDGLPDLLVWSEGEGLQLHRNQGNGHHGLWLELTGYNAIQGQFRLRSNAQGFGAWASAQAGEVWAGQENTTLSAGLGQSLQPLLLGLGPSPRADVLRLRWPDGTRQAELDLHAGTLLHIAESNRKTGSCPVLFAWDGAHFGFVTDFLGAGSLGERGPDGSCRPPRPEESITIEAGRLVPRDGSYVLKFAEPMDEITYLDRLELVVLDRPAEVHVYPDERFVTQGPPPTQQLIAFRERIFPVTAHDHRGRDVTRTLREWDRNTVDGFARRSWLGFAEEHAVELDFGDRLAGYSKGDRLFLCLAGWTDYPYPESIWAAHQASVAVQPPVLERQRPDGRWQPVAEAGFPAGLPRMMLLEVTGRLTGPRCRLRLRTNLQVYWDQAFVAARCREVAAPDSGRPGKDVERLPVRAACLEVAAATLGPCGLMREYAPDGRPPTQYDHDQYDAVPVVHLAGRMTRYGDVAELLRATDDRFVIFGPGDEVSVQFDARSLPALPAGWKRSFVLRTVGYCKDAGPFTATGTTVEPLPFRAMRRYPYAPDQHYPDDPPHRDYQRRFNTRVCGR